MQMQKINAKKNLLGLEPTTNCLNQYNLDTTTGQIWMSKMDQELIYIKRGRMWSLNRLWRLRPILSAVFKNIYKHVYYINVRIAYLVFKNIILII